MKRHNLVICAILAVVLLLAGCASETITVTEKSITTPMVIVTPTITTTVMPIATSSTPKTTQSLIITTTSTKNTLTATTVSTIKKINIEYSATTSTKIGNNTPKSGYTYLIVKYKVENSGYFNFYVGPENLKVTVKSITYDYDVAAQSTVENSFTSHGATGAATGDTTPLKNGQLYTGQVVYQIPTSDISLSFTPSYIATVYGVSYEFQWVKLQ